MVRVRVRFGMDPDIPSEEEIREFLKVRIGRAKISQDELADRMGTTPSTVSKLLNGGMYLDYEWMAKFAKALKCSVAEIVLDPDTVTIGDMLIEVPEPDRKRVAGIVKAAIAPPE